MTFPDGVLHSSAVSSVIARVHHSVAELVRWSDQLLLRGDEAHNTQTVQQVVQTVRDAVQVSPLLLYDAYYRYMEQS